MLGRTRILVAAACAVASLTLAARAEETTKQQVEGAPAAQNGSPAVAAAAPARKPLMSLLDAAGIGKALDDLGINVFGFAQASYEYNFSNPAGRNNFGRVFDVDEEEVILNQLDLTIQRTVDATKVANGFGFTIETIYGADSRFIHTNGLDFYGPGDVARGPQLDPENQFDLAQAYVDIVPVEKLMIRAGKFATHVGYETINPTTTPFFSHSYAFGFAIPFFHTGVEAYYYPTDKLTIMAGITRGWEQSLKDDNDVIDYVGQVKYVFTDKLTGFFNFTGGPEKTNGNNNDTRVILDGILQYAFTDQFSMAVNGDYGWEEGDLANGDNAFWYGTSLYASYKINDPLTFNARVEWFDDQDGARGFGCTLYEATAGFTITPFPSNDILSNLKFRPEIRWDYADEQVFGSENSQFTAAIDAIFAY